MDHPDIKYFEVSAQSGEGISEMFAYVGEELFQKEEEKKPIEDEHEDNGGNAYTLGDPNVNGGNKYKRGCCK